MSSTVAAQPQPKKLLLTAEAPRSPISRGTLKGHFKVLQVWALLQEGSPALCDVAAGLHHRLGKHTKKRNWNFNLLPDTLPTQRHWDCSTQNISHAWCRSFQLLIKPLQVPGDNKQKLISFHSGNSGCPAIPAATSLGTSLCTSPSRRLFYLFFHTQVVGKDGDMRLRIYLEVVSLPQRWVK